LVVKGNVLKSNHKGTLPIRDLKGRSQKRRKGNGTTAGTLGESGAKKMSRLKGKGENGGGGKLSLGN